MDRLDSTVAISYCNLSLSSKTGMGNDSLFQMKDITQNGGSVVYRINNASKVSAVVYSPVGTQLYTNSKSNFFLGSGIFQPPLTPANLPTFYSPSGKGVYILPAGSPQRLCYHNSYGYYFSTVDSIPNDLINYTVNIYVSADGKTYSPLSPLRISSQFVDGMALVREEWSAFIPPGVTYLKVALNDFPQIFTQPQGVYEPRSAETMAMLAYVDIEGDGLIIGVPQPLEVSTGWPASSSKDRTESSKSSSSKSSSVSKPSSTPSSSPSTVSTSPSSSTSTKFEGIVYPESSTQKTSSFASTSKFEGAPSLSKTEALESVTKEDSSSNHSEGTSPETFFISGNDNRTTENSSIFIVGYVLLLTAGIFLALKNRSGSGK